MATTAPKELKTVPKAPANAVPHAAANGDAGPPKKKRSVAKLLLVLVLALALLGGAGGGAWYFLGDEEPTAPVKTGAAKTGAAKAVSAKSGPAKVPLFAPLEPFTVNLQPEDASPQYLQVGLSLKVTDASVVEAVKLHMPEIRNRVLLLLSSKKASDISTLEGKRVLSTALAGEVAQPLAGGVPGQGIESVLFTSFVIQ